MTRSAARTRRRIQTVLVAALALMAPMAAPSVVAQEGPRLPDGTPRGSQPAEVVQRVGATEIAIRFNRPSARGRALFGALVPYDSIWTPGADEATRIELNTPVRVEGALLLFHFPMATRDSARLELRWGTVAVPVEIVPVQ